MKIWTRRPRHLAWKKWFAWYPVWVPFGMHSKLVWLQFVERRWSVKENVDSSQGWEYQLLE